MPILLLFLFFVACNSQIAQQNNRLPPVPVFDNETYAGVFRPLDGNWEGKFMVYTDPRGQQIGVALPQAISYEQLQGLPLEVTTIIEVKQFYQSQTPYYQTVEIEDTYQDGKTVRSTGYNKVEAGKLLCVVNKPDEQIIHEGLTDGEHTIIWQRDLRNPTKIEYFQETVKQDSYTIVGWGYYGNDDPSKSPRTWFYGEYKRQ